MSQSQAPKLPSLTPSYANSTQGRIGQSQLGLKNPWGVNSAFGTVTKHHANQQGHSADPDLLLTILTQAT